MFQCILNRKFGTRENSSLKSKEKRGKELLDFIIKFASCKTVNDGGELIEPKVVELLQFALGRHGKHYLLKLITSEILNSFHEKQELETKKDRQLISVILEKMLLGQRNYQRVMLNWFQENLHKHIGYPLFFSSH